MEDLLPEFLTKALEGMELLNTARAYREVQP